MFAIPLIMDKDERNPINAVKLSARTFLSIWKKSAFIGLSLGLIGIAAFVILALASGAYLAICQTLKSHYQKTGSQVSLANTAEDGIAIALASNIDAIISDIRLPGKDGLELLHEVKAQKPTLPIIMITAFHDLEMTVAAMQGGAMDYVAKPIDLAELDAALSRA